MPIIHGMQVDFYMSADTAQTVSSESVDGFLANESLIRDYRYCTCGGKIAVALITEPIFGLAEAENFRTRIRETLLGEYGFAEAEVTFDTDLFYEIGKLGGNAAAEDVDRICGSIRARR